MLTLEFNKNRYNTHKIHEFLISFADTCSIRGGSKGVWIQTLGAHNSNTDRIPFNHCLKQVLGL